ncbi:MULTISPECIES: alpha/beta hydrolase [Pantoea]|jgi:predicted alpha/beta hydrolase family esterase|uniref:RBBP9/YdeN family alpha/beta hydrolase n=1 Tax=Pantoea TaxID=53335 RepID=UPI001911661B|nr:MULTISPECIES: alpha/beta fold hydrolase [Pantoea]MBK5013397.1 alpha/beta hydrolase [Pantoea sp. S62]MCX3311640.1 alpha/beta hydrolase [Pantoea vagans]
MTTTYLIVPGYTNSGPDHWQSFMERKYSNVMRVQQDDWNTPCSLWVNRLNQVIVGTQGDIVLLGHSCGAVAVAQWAATHSCNRVKSLILVAPADVDAETAIVPIRQQRPLPAGTLGYNALLIHSDNDEHLSEARAHALAAEWRCKTHLFSGAGHIHTAAGYGEWPEGERLFENFTGIALLSVREKD